MGSGKGGGRTQTQVVRNEIDPWAQANQTGAMNWGITNALQPYQPYYGDRVAGFNTDQVGAFDMTRGIYGNAQQQLAPAQNALSNLGMIQSQPAQYQPFTGGVQYSPATNPAGTAAATQASAAGYTPSASVQGQGYNAATGSAAQMNRGDVQNVTAQQLANTNLQPYMNPFQQEVIDRSLSNMERQRQIALNTGGDAAMRAGAYGGSRHGVADSLTNAESLRAMGDLSANLNLQNFSQAQNAAVGDISRRLQADLSNQGMDYNVGALNTGNRQQMGLTNLGFINDASRYGADSAMQAALANQGALNTAGQFNAANQQSANMANASAANNMAQFNASQGQNLALANAQNQMAAQQFNANLGMTNASNALQNSQFNAGQNMAAQQANQANQLAAANQLGQLGQLGMDAYGRQIAGMSQAGGLQQANQQARLDQNYADFLEARNHPNQQWQQILQAVGALTPGSTSTQTTPQYSANPLGSALGGGLAGYALTAGTALGGPWGAVIGGLGGLLNR